MDVDAESVSFAVAAGEVAIVMLTPRGRAREGGGGALLDDSMSAQH